MKFKTNFPKGILMPLLFFIFTTLVFTNCKKDNLDPPGTNVGNGTISMKIDGVTWESANTDNGAVIANSQGSTIIKGQAADGSQLNIQLLTPSSGDVWDFNNGGGLSYQLDISDSGFIFAPGQGNSGNITFTTFNNNKAVGTFQATISKFSASGTETKIISDGKFDLNF